MGLRLPQRPEAAERRRVEAAAELQRQREQEEWDRAFEEELMQTGLPEDVVAACVYQILAVRASVFSAVFSGEKRKHKGNVHGRRHRVFLQ